MTSIGVAGNDAIESRNFADVERFVQRLYQPGSPQDIAGIQDSLQNLQRSQQGWRVADALLRSQDEKVRFFGALTFTIKINHDWESLKDEDASLLLDTLIQWLIRLVNAGEGQLVIRKLCSSLTAYYLRPSSIWKQCIRDLVMSFDEGHPVPSSSSAQGVLTESIVARLSQPSLLAVLWFAGGLVEEVSKANAASIQSYKYYERVSSNLGDAVLVLRYSMTASTQRDLRLAREGVKCLQSWVFYSHRAFIDKAFDVEPLRPLTSLVIEALEHEDMYAVTVEFLTDVLNHFSAFLTSDNISSLSSIMTSTQAQTFISRLKSGDFDTDTTSFARLLLAFGDVNIESLAKVEHPLFDKIGHELLDLLSCEGYAGVEDQICSEALEFWMTYTEYLIDAIFAAGEETPNWMGNARLRVETVIEACWVKIRMPANEIATDWDSDDRAGFKSFREDVQDLLQCAHTLLGVEIFGKLAQLALQSLNGRAWLHLEATLFCLNALSDSISDEASVDQILSRVFGSTLFGDMARIDETVPAKTRHTAVSMITRYTTFFERHVDHLPPMLNFLFESLKAPALANVAAKAIFSSCSSCRKILIPELGAFLQQYEVLLTWATADTYTKEKVMGAIAAIIQAIPTDEEKYAPLSVLIRFVERDANDCIRSTKSSQAEETQASGVCALRCLVSIGKALQAPDDAVIDLDAETPQSMYWIEGQGASLQAKIIQMLETITGLMRWDSDVVEAGCQVLRTGYKESTPGLFVLPPKVSVNFVLSSKLDTARLDYVLDTAGAMISRHATESEDTMKNVASSFIGHLLVIVEMLGRNPSSDPEVASSGIDLADKMIPHRLDCMMNALNIQNLFDFALKGLTAPEIMPKRAAAHFWASFVQRYELPGNVAVFVEAVMQQYGPQLCYVLVYHIGGIAARSELDILSEPLKKLVFAQPQAKIWLSDALNSKDFPSQKVGLTEKRIWLQQIMNLRGARGTNQAVKDFWISCRGPAFAYIS